MSKRLALFILLIIVLALGVSQCLTYETSTQIKPFQWDMSLENHTGMSKKLYATDGKHRGMSAFNWRGDNKESVNQLVKNNIEHVALVPFMFQETDTTKTLRGLRKGIGEWGQYDSSYMQIIDELHSRDMNVFFKPHIWMREGWRSNIKMDNKQEWNTWFDSYREHIIHHAKLAEMKNVEMFCIGTELRSSINNTPNRWIELIKEIKSIYKGKLTYASNWDGEFNDVNFWDQMDYIGIQGYFPLTKNENPTQQQIEKGWQKHIKTLAKLAEKHNKKILFTETGYRSDFSATVEPWEWGTNQDSTGVNVSNHTQMYAYEALFGQLWNKDWFAGTYFWQWHNRHSPEYTVHNMDFTPRYKPAENVLAKWYGKKE